jgi:hypothetical protein
MDLHQTSPATLTKAVLRASERLGLTDVLPGILGMSHRDVAGMHDGHRLLDASQQEWAAASELLSLYRSLLTALDSVDEAMHWLRTPHHSLGATPMELLLSAEGRGRVLRYLDAVQKFEIKLPQRKH